MKKLWFPAEGDKVIHADETLEIAMVGTGAYIAWGGGVVPVGFTDQTAGIVSFGEVKDDEEPKLHAWVPDLLEAAEALRHAKSIDVGHGIGSDVMHVRVTAADGRKALIKLFYNAKKLEHNRQDELHWLPAIEGKPA